MYSTYNMVVLLWHQSCHNMHVMFKVYYNPSSLEQLKSSRGEDVMLEASSTLPTYRYVNSAVQCTSSSQEKNRRMQSMPQSDHLVVCIICAVQLCWEQAERASDCV